MAMVAIQTLASDASTDAINEVMQRDGACIVESLLTSEEVDLIVREVMPFVDMTATGSDDFTGRQTQRTGALVARSPACCDVVMNQKIRAAAERFLSPFTERLLLHLTQIIRILPNQGSQTLHRDRLAWGTHLPREIEPQFNTLWALTEFTSENGATRVVPGSQSWDWEDRAEPEQICQAEMPRGSVLLYTGSVIHGGGQNTSSDPRMGLNITYCLGWLRQEENQYLSCPPAVARTLPDELQELLGYTMGNYALGYYSEPDPAADRDGAASGRSDIRPPERALGRRPREGTAFSSIDAENVE
jgi:ectoine hydroxylase-related dioxygenase (phytanoyl-CoA dioxygenase family)